jgi:hypothetical protein
MKNIINPGVWAAPTLLDSQFFGNYLGARLRLRRYKLLFGSEVYLIAGGDQINFASK